MQNDKFKDDLKEWTLLKFHKQGYMSRVYIFFVVT